MMSQLVLGKIILFFLTWLQVENVVGGKPITAQNSNALANSIMGKIFRTLYVFNLNLGVFYFQQDKKKGIL